MTCCDLSRERDNEQCKHGVLVEFAIMGNRDLTEAKVRKYGGLRSCGRPEDLTYVEGLCGGEKG